MPRDHRAMTYILHGDRGSGSAPIEMALAEIGASVALREVPLATDAHLAAGNKVYDYVLAG